MWEDTDTWDERDLEGVDDEPEPGPVKCKYCGKRKFHWGYIMGTPCKWRLYTPTGQLHTCKAYQAKYPEVKDPILKKRVKFEAHYAGPKSSEFWKAINSLQPGDKDALYALGCALQNFECDVIRQLNVAMKDET